VKNERRLFAGFTDMSSALSLIRLNPSPPGRFGQVGQVVYSALYRLLAQRILTANASIWALREGLL
jgi:hypothetical protein